MLPIVDEVRTLDWVGEFGDLELSREKLINISRFVIPDSLYNTDKATENC